MADPNSMNGNHMDAVPLNAMTAEAMESLSEEDLMAALSMTNMQAGTNLTMEDLEAAMALVYLSDSSTQKPATSIRKSNIYPAFGNIQANETTGQHQEEQDHVIAHKPPRRAKQPMDHRKAEYRKSLAQETESHREERLQKKAKAERAQ